MLFRSKLSGNWMTYSKSMECLDLLYKGVSRLVEVLQHLELSIDGGKDSLSMVMKKDENEIISPPSLVLTSYSQLEEISIERRVLPLLTSIHESRLYVINIMKYLTLDDYNGLKTVWDNIQKLIYDGVILALHDGGNILDILEEMALVKIGRAHV